VLYHQPNPYCSVNHAHTHTHTYTQTHAHRIQRVIGIRFLYLVMLVACALIVSALSSRTRWVSSCSFPLQMQKDIRMPPFGFPSDIDLYQFSFAHLGLLSLHLERQPRKYTDTLTLSSYALLS